MVNPKDGYNRAIADRGIMTALPGSASTKLLLLKQMDCSLNLGEGHTFHVVIFFWSIAHSRGFRVFPSNFLGRFQVLISF